MAEIKNICFFASYYSFAARSLMESYETILSENVNLFLFCPQSDIEKFNLKRVQKFSYYDKYTLLFDLRSFCKANNIDLIVNVAGSGSTSFLLVFSKLFTKMKYMAFQHGTFFWRLKDINSFPFFAFTIVHNLKHLFLFISQFFMERLLLSSINLTKRIKRLFFLNKNKIFYLTSAINTNFFKPKDKELARKKLEISRDEKVILYSGRIAYLKGSDFLYKIVEKNPDKKFIFIGDLIDKKFKKPFKNLIILPNKSQKELIYYYSAADLFIFLSRTEGNPLVPREAMCCHLPCLLSDIDALTSYKHSIIVPFNTKKIQEAIDKFFEMSEKEREKLGKKCREYVVKESSYQALKNNYRKYFLDF